MRPVHPCRCAPPAHQYGSVVGLPWVAQRYVGSLDMEDKGSDFEVAAGRSETAAAVVIGL